MNNLFKNVFTDVRTATDVCYVDIITKLLTDLGHPNPSNWFDQLKNTQEIKAAAPKLQRFLINRALRISFGLLEADTTAVRFCLVDDCDHEGYMEVFQTVVAPAMLQHQI